MTLAFIAAGQSRRPALIIEKIACTASVSGKKGCHAASHFASADTFVPEASPVKTPPSWRVEHLHCLNFIAVASSSIEVAHFILEKFGKTN